MLANCSRGTVFIFEYMDLAPPEQIFTIPSIILYLVEVLIKILSFSLVLAVIYLIFYQPLWHKNLRIIMAYFVAGSLPVMFCRLVFIYYELTFNIRNICKPFLILASFVRLQYYYAIMHASVALIVERTAAFIFLKDYEKKSRHYIPATILVCQIGLSASMASVNMVDAFDFKTLFIYMSSLAVISLVGFTCLKFLNARKFKTIGISARMKDYSLSKRFQLTENLRALDSIRNMELCLVFMLVLVGALGFVMNKIVKTAVGIHIFEISLSCIPMVLTLSLLLTSKKWRSHVLSRVRPAFESSPRKIGPNEGQLYFTHLDKVWSKHS